MENFLVFGLWQIIVSAGRIILCWGRKDLHKLVDAKLHWFWMSFMGKKRKIFNVINRSIKLMYVFSI